MNTFSWLIYFADVVGAIDTPLVVVTFAAIIILFFGFMASDGEVSGEFVKLCLAIAAVCFVLQALVPSQKTVLMIAASEIGEEVLASPEIERLRSIVGKKLDELEKAE